MTGPDDSQSTRPISVAELLARNGTIGAPPVGGRRRRRRGDTDSISVAELTGEIPIVTDHDIVDTEVEEPETSPAPSPLADEHDEPISPVTSNGVVDHQDAETDSVDEFQDVDDTDHETDTDTDDRHRRPTLTTPTTPTTTTPVRSPTTRPTSSSGKPTSTCPSSLRRGARATPRAASTRTWWAPRR